MVNSVSMGSSIAFSTTAAVVYSSKNTTNLNEVLDEDQISWLGMPNFENIYKMHYSRVPNKRTPLNNRTPRTFLAKMNKRTPLIST